jgi:hypothetical protein
MVQNTYRRSPARGVARCCTPWTFILGLAFLSIVVAGIATLLYFILAPGKINKPLVLIKSPGNFQQLDVGQEIKIQALARDKSKVTRIELWVDGALVNVEHSSQPGGISPFPLLISWQPVISGQHTLTVRAFNNRGGRGLASVLVEALPSVDADNDHVADNIDMCPQEPGPGFAAGCPDRDGDSVDDNRDACPDQAGLAITEGCPSPGKNDLDGDGVWDSSDACPGEAGSPFSDGCPDADGDGLVGVADLCAAELGLPENGGCSLPGDVDGDGIVDTVDRCPSVPGVWDMEGCADSDGDGIADSADACLDEAGLPDLSGCPDRDGDRTGDSQDLCPDTAGPIENFGCPVSGAGDRDLDGIADDIDPCSDEPGAPEHAGCPPPGMGEDSDGDGLPDAEEGGGYIVPRGVIENLLLHELKDILPVEFQALEFMLNGEFDYVTCYTNLNDQGLERWGPFHIGLAGLETWPLGDWAELTGNSNVRNFFADNTTLLNVYVECAVENTPAIGSGARPVYFNLGSFTQSHPASDWDGHVITVVSTGGDGGRSFSAKYRICTPACEQALFQPPRLILTEVSGPGGLLYGQLLSWEWEGDPAEIDGFKLYINGAGVQSFDRRISAYRLTEDLAPACDERLDFTITAYSGSTISPERESPPSNTVRVEGPACSRNIQLTFERLILDSSIGSDEYNVGEGHGGNNSQGPIYGNFWAGSDSDFESLEFDAADCMYWMMVLCDGYYLLPTIDRDIPIMDIFNWIHNHMDLNPLYGMHRFTPTYFNPNRNTITVEVGVDDELRFGGKIRDEDWWSRDDTLFNQSRILGPREVIPGEYILTNGSGNIQLVVQLDILDEP